MGRGGNNMDEKKIDSLIAETLFEKTEELSLSPVVKQNVKLKLFKENKEEYHMKRHFSRKVIIIAAALCLVGTMGAIAAGRGVSLVSHTDQNNPTYKNYEELASHAEQELGYSMKTTDELGDGYLFRSADISTVESQDAAGNAVGAYKNLSILFQAKDRTKIQLNINHPGALADEDIRRPDAQKEYEGTELSYYVDHYKFLPVGAEVSEEDLAAQERGELFLSYGSDQEEVEDFYSVSWKEAGVHYSIMSMEKSLTPEELFAMAEKVISGGE